MTNSNIKITIKIKWWVRYLYIPSLVLFVKFCRLFNEDAEPNWDKVANIIIKGTEVK